MRSLEFLENQLVVPRIALDRDIETAEFIKYNPGCFEYDPCFDMFVMKPHYVSAGLRWIAKQAP